MFYFHRQLQLMAHQHQSAGRLFVALADILDQSHVHRIAQIRVEIEQHVNAGLVRCADCP